MTPLVPTISATVTPCGSAACVGTQHSTRAQVSKASSERAWKTTRARMSDCDTFWFPCRARQRVRPSAPRRPAALRRCCAHLLKRDEAANEHPRSCYRADQHQRAARGSLRKHHG